MLNLGLQGRVPIIETVPFNIRADHIRRAFSLFSLATHLVFTSQRAIGYFLSCARYYRVPFREKKVFAIGKKTAYKARKHGFRVLDVPEIETSEGLLELLQEVEYPLFFLPRSLISRLVLVRNLPCIDCPLYTTRSVARFPFSYEQVLTFDKVFFSSPSTVEAFLHHFKRLPPEEKWAFQGDVTKHALTNSKRQERVCE